MSSKSKSELLAVVDEQKEKIEKYENKIRDIVRAYKSLSKEKEAIQASLSALTTTAVLSSEKGSENQDTESTCGDGGENESSKKTSSEDDPLRTEITSLQKKVDILTSTLQTLTEEKNKLESTTTAERKRILAEKNKLEENFNFESESWLKMKNEYEVKLQELRSKIILSQHEVEKEANNGIIMLKEIETELSRERVEKSKLEKLLEETQSQNRQFATAFGNRTQETKQQKQISDLQNELEQVRMRLRKAEEQSENPPALIALRTQMEGMKSQYAETLLQEQRRAEAAERNFKSLSRSHEERVAALEASLSEVSLSAGGWDRKNRKFLQTIESLKDKINELSDRQEEQIKFNSSFEVTTDSQLNSESTESVSLVREFILLGKRIRDCSIIEEKDLAKVKELFYGWEELHSRCNERLKLYENKIKLLEEESRSSNRDASESSLQNLISELRERIRSLNSALQTTQSNHDEQVSVLKQEMKLARENYDKSVKQQEQDYKTTLAKVEQELMEQKHTSLCTLQDREQEIHRLSQEIFRLNQQAAAQPRTVAEALLTQVKSGGSVDRPLLHHMEDLARKELEVNKLRREKMFLEKAMREIQMFTTDKQQAMQDTIDELKEQVDRMTRNQSREGENLEYVKNIVFQYMLSPDLESRLVILKAVGAVLKFTSEETEKVKKNLNLWWWQTPSKPKEPSLKTIIQPSTSSARFDMYENNLNLGTSHNNVRVNRVRSYSDVDSQWQGSTERANKSIFDNIL